jgi:riboflavin biosynthesis pyrimidine reductase
MLSEYPKIDYDYDRISLKKIYEHEMLAACSPAPVQTADSRKVFGELRFPPLPAERTYNLASFVTSIDGKIAYLDNPAGPVIAQSNALDPDGASADFWVLNLMRASVDAVFAGAGTMQKEPDGLVCLFDRGLEDARVQAGKPKAPWVVICSLDGTDIRFQDTLLKNQPVMFNSSPAGMQRILDGIDQPCYVVGPYRTVEDIDPDSVADDFHRQVPGHIPVIISGEGNRTNSQVVMRILKLMGLDITIVESPSYCHSLLHDGLLDEISLNYSCVYVGGKAVGLGHGMEPFTSVNHPHTEMLSIHTHSPSFFYFRHRFIHNRKPEGYLGSVY